MYDPNRPNDLGEYQAYRKRARAEKKAQLVADKLRRDRGGSDAESSYYTDSEEEAPRRDGEYPLKQCTDFSAEDVCSTKIVLSACFYRSSTS